MLFFFFKPVFYVLISIIGPAIIISIVFSIDPKEQPEWSKSYGSWTMNHAKRYFSLTVKMEDFESVNNAGACLFALEPHDVLPVRSPMAQFNPQLTQLNPNFMPNLTVSSGGVTTSTFYQNKRTVGV